MSLPPPDSHLAAGCLQSILTLMRPEVAAFVAHRRLQLQQQVPTPVNYQARSAPSLGDKDLADQLKFIRDHWDVCFAPFEEKPFLSVVGRVLAFRHRVAHQMPLRAGDWQRALAACQELLGFIGASRVTMEQVKAVAQQMNRPPSVPSGSPVKSPVHAKLWTKTSPMSLGGVEAKILAKMSPNFLVRQQQRDRCVARAKELMQMNEHARNVEAVHELCTALKLFPKDNGLKSLRAQCYLRLKKLDHALQDAQDVAANNSKDPSSFRRLCEVLFAMERQQEAMDACERGLRVQSSSVALLEWKKRLENELSSPQQDHVERTLMWLKNRDYENAFWSANQLIARHSKRPQYFVLAAHSGMGARMYSKARDAASSALALNENCVEAHQWLVEALVQLWQYNVALEACERALVLSPTNEILQSFKQEIRECLAQGDSLQRYQANKLANVTSIVQPCIVSFVKKTGDFYGHGDLDESSLLSILQLVKDYWSTHFRPIHNDELLTSVELVHWQCLRLSLQIEFTRPMAEMALTHVTKLLVLMESFEETKSSIEQLKQALENQGEVNALPAVSKFPEQTPPVKLVTPMDPRSRERDAHVAQAKAVLQNKSSDAELADAVKHLTDAIDIFPRDMGLCVIRAKCFLRLGQLDHAVEDAELAASYNSNDANSYCLLCEVLYAMSRHDEVAAACTRGLCIHPSNPTLLSWQSRMQQKKTFSESRLNANESSDDNLADFGLKTPEEKAKSVFELLRQRNFKSAIVAVDRFLKDEAKHASWYVLHAHCCMGMHQYHQALASTFKAIAVENTLFEAYVWQIEALLQINQVDAASRICADGLRLSSTNAILNLLQTEIETCLAKRDNKSQECRGHDWTHIQAMIDIIQPEVARFVRAKASKMSIEMPNDSPWQFCDLLQWIRDHFLPVENDANKDVSPLIEVLQWYCTRIALRETWTRAMLETAYQKFSELLAWVDASVQTVGILSKFTEKMSNDDGNVRIPLFCAVSEPTSSLAYTVPIQLPVLVKCLQSVFDLCYREMASFMKRRNACITVEDTADRPTGVMLSELLDFARSHWKTHFEAHVDLYWLIQSAQWYKYCLRIVEGQPMSPHMQQVALTRLIPRFENLLIAIGSPSQVQAQLAQITGELNASVRNEPVQPTLKSDANEKLYCLFCESNGKLDSGEMSASEQFTSQNIPSIPAFIERSRLLLRKFQFKQALRALNTVINLGAPQTVDMCILKTHCHMGMLKYVKARECAEAAVALNATSSIAYSWLVEALVQLKYHSDAIRMCAQGLKECPLDTILLCLQQELNELQAEDDMNRRAPWTSMQPALDILRVELLAYVKNFCSESHELQIRESATESIFPDIFMTVRDYWRKKPTTSKKEEWMRILTLIEWHCLRVSLKVEWTTPMLRLAVTHFTCFLELANASLDGKEAIKSIKKSISTTLDTKVKMQLLQRAIDIVHPEVSSFLNAYGCDLPAMPGSSRAQLLSQHLCFVRDHYKFHGTFTPTDSLKVVKLAGWHCTRVTKDLEWTPDMLATAMNSFMQLLQLIHASRSAQTQLQQVMQEHNRAFAAGAIAGKLLDKVTQLAHPWNQRSAENGFKPQTPAKHLITTDENASKQALSRALELLIQRNFSNALHAIIVAVENGMQDSAKLWVLRAYGRMGMRAYQQAIVAANQAVGMNPKLAQAYRWLYEACVQSKDFYSAILASKEGIRMCPNDCVLVFIKDEVQALNDIATSIDWISWERVQELIDNVTPAVAAFMKACGDDIAATTTIMPLLPLLERIRTQCISQYHTLARQQIVERALWHCIRVSVRAQFTNAMYETASKDFEALRLIIHTFDHVEEEKPKPKSNSNNPTTSVDPLTASNANDAIEKREAVETSRSSVSTLHRGTELSSNNSSQTFQGNAAATEALLPLYARHSIQISPLLRQFPISGATFPSFTVPLICQTKNLQQVNAITNQGGDHCLRDREQGKAPSTPTTPTLSPRVVATTKAVKYQARGEYEEAIAYCTEAIQYLNETTPSPMASALLVRRAECRQALGQWQNALEDAKQALTMRCGHYAKAEGVLFQLRRHFGSLDFSDIIPKEALNLVVARTMTSEECLAESKDWRMHENWQQATKWCSAALAYLGKQKSSPLIRIAEAYHARAECYAQGKQWLKVLEDADRSIHASLGHYTPAYAIKSRALEALHSTTQD